MNLRDYQRLASFLSLVLLVLIGTFLVLRATPEGLGLSDDSIAYIAGARSLLAGEGYREAWLATNQPVTHFPPGFPSALMFLGWFGLDPLRGARFLNALLFGLNAGLLGILAWRMTPSLVAGLVMAALFVLNGDLLQVHTFAMSEPLFIFLSLLSFWMFDLYFELPPSSVGRGVAGEWWWLAACGAFAGLAYLTRYAGLALAATFIVAIVVLRSNWRKRFTSIGIFLGGFMPWVLFWAFRNRIVAESATNRSFAWHPITAENVEIGLRTFTEFLIPVPSWFKVVIKTPGLPEAMLIAILGPILAWTCVKAWNTLSKPRKAEELKRGGKESREVITFTTALYLFAYLAAIVASMTMFDAATKFRLRILSPVFVSLLILLVYAGIWLGKRNRGVVVAFVLVFLGFSFYEQNITVAAWEKGGIGYASFQWYDSEAMAYLRELPDDVVIFTNEPGAVYLYTGRGAYVLPSGYDSARAEFVPGFEEGVERMQEDIHAGHAVLAIFDRGDNIADEVGALSDGLYLAHRSAGDFIYTREP